MADGNTANSYANNWYCNSTSRVHYCPAVHICNMWRSITNSSICCDNNSGDTFILVIIGVKATLHLMGEREIDNRLLGHTTSGKKQDLRRGSDRGVEGESEGVCGGLDRKIDRALRKGDDVVVCLPGAKMRL